MKLDFFSRGDSVLLVGEGNFSFSLNLLKHKLPIFITATCFENNILYNQQQDNINCLKSKDVSIYFNVDATKLHENENIKDKKFSKIIFNFPHIGGKMKIHLNRELLKNFFISSSQIIKNDGFVVISLCKGQGGTPIESPQRKWSDSWQITEYSAHGGFILINVEPFNRDNFKEYSCIGYRSQDVKFNLDGALVYYFIKKKLPYEILTDKTISDRLNSVSLNDSIRVPYFLSEMYANNPLKNENSPFSYLKNILFKNIEEFVESTHMNFIFFSLHDILLHLNKLPTYIMEKDSNQNEILFYPNLMDNFILINRLCNAKLDDKIIFFPQMYIINKLPKDFIRTPPIKFKFIIVGNKILKLIKSYLESLLKIFKEKDVVMSTREKQIFQNSCEANGLSLKSETAVILEKTDEIFIPAIVYNLETSKKNYEMCIINVDETCEYLFKTESWREIWSESNNVVVVEKEKPMLKQLMLFPNSYKFDITLRYSEEKKYSDEKIYETLWKVGGQVIEEVKLISEYKSEKNNWSSKCYRITYKSIDKPLYREHVIKIHSKLIGPALEYTSNVFIG